MMPSYRFPVNMMKRKVGVVLSGCGFLDGAEISEAVLTLLALDRQDLQAVCMAPNEPQAQVVDHLTGEQVPGESRNVLREAARIARGEIRDWQDVRADELDALVMPGGFGAAKNLSDFATRGRQATAHPEIARLLRDMHAQKKPIGAICISPALVACVLGKQARPTLTIGSDPGTAEELQEMGAVHRDSTVDVCVVDEGNRIVSTAAFMCEARLKDISAGIHELVAAMVKMLDSDSAAVGGNR
tara:strand:+ start:655 stop:1383 length:729 start_codon:yes stop_codon:yes gene_type:complete